MWSQVLFCYQMYILPQFQIYIEFIYSKNGANSEDLNKTQMSSSPLGDVGFGSGSVSSC